MNETRLVPINPQWVDIERLRTWLVICDKEHGVKCEPPPQVVGQHYRPPERLIDVQSGCLVPYKANHRYMALSYVQGHTTNARTLKANLESFHTERALFRENMDPPLSRTVRDAVKLTELLGERYLWVDALCIVQDLDIKEQEVHLQSVPSVYGNAYCTIVAASGSDANHGLRGIKGVTDPRHCSAYSFWDNLMPHASVWYSMGWTLQELIFSRRIIMFHYQIAVWECQCSTWHEAIHPRDLGCRKPRRHHTYYDLISQHLNTFHISEWPEGLEFSFWPNLKHYFDIVNNYTARNLNNLKDIFNAFAGIISIFNHRFSGGFIYGLPEMFFDVALLWQPLYPSERRLFRDGVRFPSWSWMGWIGVVDPRSWESGYDYIRSVRSIPITPPTSSTISTIRWFSSDRTGQNKRPIETTYKRYEKYKLKIATSMPPGWCKLPGVSQLGRGENARPKFAHHESGTTEGTFFNYPIPIKSSAESLDTGPGNLFLQCKTWRARFHRSRALRKGYDNSSLPHIALLDDEDAVVGILRLRVPHPPPPRRWLRGYEVIELSAGEDWGTEEDALRKGPRGSQYAFYNVMWIIWGHLGIAYRPAVGRVLRDSWEMYATEWISVVLG
jgi:Heterokaryon incompatibility protein (HET)